MKKLFLLLPLLLILVLVLPLTCCVSAPEVKAPPQDQTQVRVLDPDLEDLLQFSVPHSSTSTDSAPEPHHKVAWIQFEGDIRTMSASIFRDSLEKAMAINPEVVVVELNTDGGSVADGLDMAKAIERLDVPTICLVDGRGYSEGIYVLQACDLRLMTDRSQLMVHEPHYEGIIDTPHLQPLLKRQKRDTWVWTQYVAKRWKITPEELRKRIALGDWWMTSEEALAVRAVDGIIGDARDLRRGLVRDLALPGDLVFPPKK